MSKRKMIDLHVHSSIKSFGMSFEKNANPNSIDDKSCIWFEDNHDSYSEGVETYLGLARYRQSDFTNLTDGNCRIACISLYPLEKEFTNLPNPLKPRRRDLLNYVTGIGKKRIKQIKSDDYNYFEEYKKEYAFLEQLNNQIPQGGNRKYKFLEKTDNIEASSALFIIPTVEGCHFLCDGNDTSDMYNWRFIEENIEFIKTQKYPLFFVSLAHHFYNNLCTHAKSFYKLVGNVLDQKNGMDDFEHSSPYKPISDFGEGLIDLLLSTKNGTRRRVLIDLKHMSKKARERYYDILKSNKYKNQSIPVIFSHCAFDFTGEEHINLNFNDIYQVYLTRGIIGIELDQRILGYNKREINGEKSDYANAFFVWKQIKAIAEHAFVSFNGKPEYQDIADNPWQCIAIGSDYDGIINPLDSYKDASYMAVLHDNLILHLENYWNHSPFIPKNHNGMNAADVIHAIMYQNAYNFIVKHYINYTNEEAIV